ncbi:MAG: thioredoxin domain-containing protein [Sandaracinaceae bacterium]|nr:thioredoxin domain-containing protein [Sandaracinaceae bacterium]
MIAFVAGVAIGHLIAAQGGGGGEGELANIQMEGGSRGGGGDEAAPAAGAAAPADGVERLRAEVPENAPQRGPDDALVTIVMWSDYQCPFCSRVEPTLTQLVQEFGNDLRVVWRDNALPFHQNAMPAAEAAREAYAQGGDQKFWQMHDLLFENQQALARADLERYAQQAGLNMDRFRAALDNHTHQAAIQADMNAANALGARGTPAFFINGRQLMGAQPIAEFQRVVREELTAARRMVESGTPRNRVYAALMRSARTAPAPEPAAAQQQPQQPRPQPDPAAIYRVPVGDSPFEGPADALVTIVAFSEFQCPFCSRVLPTMEQLRERYGNDVRVVFKHNPLPFHPNAMPAAQAAVEVFTQGGAEKFWRYHDVLFENQQNLTRENLEAWAQALGGINMARFRAALDNNTHQNRVQQDQQLAQQLGASGTPSFFINGRNLRGAQPFEAFQRVVDEELARARQLVASGTPRAQVYEAATRDGHTSPQMIQPPAGAAPAQPAAPAEPPPDQVYQIAVPRNAPSRGPASAQVTIQLFSDFQCPFCGRVGPTVDQIVERYGNRVRIVWRNYPLPFHQNAMPAAEAAMEVFAQGGSEKFWRFHDVLFENQQNLTRENLEQWAQALGGINMTRFRAALDNHTHQAAIQAEMNAVQEAGARIGTPSFFINGRLLQGAQPFPAFEAAINRALEER